MEVNGCTRYVVLSPAQLASTHPSLSRLPHPIPNTTLKSLKQHHQPSQVSALFRTYLALHPSLPDYRPVQSSEYFLQHVLNNTTTINKQDLHKSKAESPACHFVSCR